MDAVDLNSLQLKQEWNPVHSPIPYRKKVCSRTTSFGDTSEKCGFLEASILLMSMKITFIEKSLISRFQWDEGRRDGQYFTCKQCGISEI